MQQEVNFTLEDLQKSATPTDQSHHRETTVSSRESVPDQPAADELVHFYQMRQILNLMLDGVRTIEDATNVKATLAKVFM